MQGTESVKLSSMHHGWLRMSIIDVNLLHVIKGVFKMQYVLIIQHFPHT